MVARGDAMSGGRWSGWARCPKASCSCITASAHFQGWDAWDALCGLADRRFEYFKGEQVRVHVADPTHQITEGVTDWEIVDEVYTLPEVGGDADRAADHRPSPQARRPWRGRGTAAVGSSATSQATTAA